MACIEKHSRAMGWIMDDVHALKTKDSQFNEQLSFMKRDTVLLEMFIHHAMC